MGLQNAIILGLGGSDRELKSDAKIPIDRRPKSKPIMRHKA